MKKRVVFATLSMAIAACSVVGNYLLWGTLATERMNRCAARSGAYGGAGFVHPAQAAALRAELSAMHSPFTR